MNVSLRTRLFLTLLAATATAGAGTLLFARWSVERGFVAFVQARQEERIARIAERLAGLYARDGGWQGLRADPRLWLALLSGREPTADGLGPPQGRGHRPQRWPRDALGQGGGRWPPERAYAPAGGGALPRPLELRLMLLDADGSVVYGRPELVPGTRRIPVEVGERTVGHLALLPGTPIAERVELRFLEQQTGALLVGAALMLALSAGLAFPLAQRLLRPVRAFQAAARRLAAGEYAARIAVEREDELGQIGRDFNALAEALQCNEQARRQWVADISHELRTPLAVLRGELEALQDGIRPIDRDAVDSLHADVRRLSRLVEDLYELSMTDLGALSYRKEDTDPLAVLREDLDAFRPRFAEAGLGLVMASRIGQPITLAADPQRLSQLFRNLLANGLRYTDRGGRLEVTASIEAGALVIDFADTPPGVPVEALPRLFDRLYRVDRSRSRETGGAGLGLAICRNIVQAHGGEITARPSPLGGLWVQVRLPL